MEAVLAVMKLAEEGAKPIGACHGIVRGKEKDGEKENKLATPMISKAFCCSTRHQAAQWHQRDMGKKVVADAGAKANTAATKTQPTKAPAPKVQAPALKQKAADKPKPQQPKEDGDKAQQPQHGGKKKGKRSDIDDIFGMASGSVAPESVALSGADEELQAVAERIKTARDAKAKAGVREDSAMPMRPAHGIMDGVSLPAPQANLLGPDGMLCSSC